MTEENGTAHVRESREVFEVAEFRLSFTCDACGTEFIFSGEKSKEKSDPTWNACPACSTDLKSADIPILFMPDNKLHDQVVLWSALAYYRAFYTLIVKHQLPLKLLVTTTEPRPGGKPKPAGAKP